ncbi:MAG: hypothetical protein Q8M49_02375, partial [Limnobacter sp.]|nr:hypothetical protein [Limnobacter sp.]
MAISALPTPPSTNDPATFATKADALLAALPDFVDEANATAAAMNLNSTTDTSASSVAIGIGAKSFTVSTGKSFQPGMYLVIADAAAPGTNQMLGTITSYDVATGALLMNINHTVGSGTKTAWVISQSAAAPVLVQRSYLAGCTMSTAGASTTLSVSAGMAVDSTNSVPMQLSAIAKTTSAWAVGTAAGGLDTGSIANNTTYHFYVIRRPDTGVVDVVFSTNAAAPTLPANYTQYRRIGSMLTNGSAQWRSFTQDGDRFSLNTTVEDIFAVAPGTAAVTRTLASIPSGIRVRGIFVAQIRTVTTGIVITGYLSDLASADEVLTNDGTSPGNFWYVGNVGSQASGAQVEVFTNTAQQIRSRIGYSDANVVLRIRTAGWYD